MRYLPICLDLTGRDTLVVGASDAVARKARLLLSVGASVTVIAADKPGRDMAALVDGNALTLHRRSFTEADAIGRAMVIVDTGDRTLDASVAAAARAAGAAVNVIDAPALSTFIMPAIVDRDPITVAISSAGTAPLLARQIRARIEAMLPANLGQLALFAERFRHAVAAVRPDGRMRRRFWERFFNGPIATLVLRGEGRRAREQMLAAINRVDEDALACRGQVVIVGAGPGDAELLTLKAARALQEADVIVYDRLVGADVLDRARRDAEFIYVGKAKGSHARSQAEINDLLVERARAGLRVVRLKGGDPFIFGRGGEEQAFVAERGIVVDVIPGITAALGCAAAAGIPLTHRDVAQAVTFVTAHGRDGEPDLDWPALARGGQTLVVYMGASVAERIAGRLLAAQANPATPVAIIHNGTLADQRVVVCPLAEVTDACVDADARPTLIIIGDVVRRAATAVARPAAITAVAG
ncbi:siroheme synthase CysG [Defluviicoccus vanus]|uniref:Uroporphyrinogen-III C-methyltransferase n=1 Tax=Defluviicoccus vanus TaxID=111831 RepID=A0A7H1N5K3_9PROT|nr:siroheme synthase CysG [Defluviicoccus vanus]QNT70989.1 uroporphyrinogen-III C-methyltransferase [Defluviicoccus vanus]